MVKKKSKKSKKKGVESPEDRKFRLKQEAELLAHNKRQARIKSREKAVQEQKDAKRKADKKVADAIKSEKAEMVRIRKKGENRTLKQDKRLRELENKYKVSVTRIKKPRQPKKKPSKITIKYLKSIGHRLNSCQKCKKLFCPRISRLMPVAIPKIKCDECDETFPDEKHLARHKESIHPVFVTQLIEEWKTIDIYCGEQGYPIIENEERYWIEKCCCVGKANSSKLGLPYENFIHLVKRGLDFRAEHRYANRKYSDKPRAWMKGGCLEVDRLGKDVKFAPEEWFDSKLSDTDRRQGHGVMGHGKRQCGLSQASYDNHWHNRTHYDYRQGFYCPYCFPEKAIKIGRQVPKVIDGKGNPEYPRMVGRGKHTMPYIAKGQAFGILNDQDLNGKHDNGHGLYGRIEGFGKIDDQHPIWSWIPFPYENAMVNEDKVSLSKLDIRQGLTRYDRWLGIVMFDKTKVTGTGGFGQGGQNATDDDSGDGTGVMIQTGEDGNDPASFDTKETPEEEQARLDKEQVEKTAKDLLDKKFAEKVRKEMERQKQEDEEKDKEKDEENDEK